MNGNGGGHAGGPVGGHAPGGPAVDHARPGAAVVGIPSGQSAISDFVRAMDAGMRKMMRDMHAPGYTGDPDADFLAMMIAHHEGAVEMARLELIHGRDPLVRRLAEDIIASQTAEIESMRARLARLRAGKADTFPALGGTRGER